MKQNRQVITVDGLAGSGKTAISKRLSEQLGFVHLSTGLVYRTVGLLTLRTKTNPDIEKSILDTIAGHKIELRMSLGKAGSKRGVVLLDGIELGEELFSPEVSEATSLSSRHAKVRSALFPVQHDAFPGENLVAEGRDMGTVVFPNAAAKFFIDVPAEIRVARRIQQMYGDTSKITEKELLKIRADMLKEVVERDARDQGRDVAPTKAANDAIIVNNSLKSLEEVVSEMSAIVKSKIVQK